jgi:undecaprenyl-diphosphatase
VFGGVLLWADRRRGKETVDAFGVREALAMGAGQALALSPGVSRSGVTMSVGLAIGFDRDAAARLSFLMSIPVIAGALLYKAVDVLTGEGIPADLRGSMAAGVLVSGLTGWVAVWGTLRLIRTRSFAPFVAYRAALGIAVLIIAATGLR